MELEHKEFLKEHYNNYETAVSGFIRDIDASILRRYEDIYKKYVDVDLCKHDQISLNLSIYNKNIR
jgi:hypothetical protein